MNAVIKNLRESAKSAFVRVPFLPVMLKTIIFDLGKVIVSYDHTRILRRVAEHCPFNEIEIQAKIFTSPHITDFDSGKTSPKEFFEAVKESLQLEMSFEDFADAWNLTFDLEPIISESFIEKLSEKYRLLVLSDTNKLHFEFIKQNFPILRFFDDFVLSYEVGYLKPSREIFQIAVGKAECAPEECLFTDDREGNVKGAEMLGINGLLFTSPEKFITDFESFEQNKKARI